MSATPECGMAAVRRQRAFPAAARGHGGQAIDLVAKALAVARLGNTSVDLPVLQLGLAHNSGVAVSLGHAPPTWLVVAPTSFITAGTSFLRLATRANRSPGSTTGASRHHGRRSRQRDQPGTGGGRHRLSAQGMVATFNLADTFLVVGCLVLVLSMLPSGRRAGPLADAPVADAVRPTAPMSNHQALVRVVRCGGTGTSRTARMCAREGTPRAWGRTSARASIGGVVHAK